MVFEFVETVFVDQAEQLALADGAGRDLGANIADDCIGDPDVALDDLEDRLDWGAAVVEADRRQA